MATTTQNVRETCERARAASLRLATLTAGEKNAALIALADALVSRTDEILEANALDLQAGRESGLSDALLDRLSLDEARVRAIADQVLEVAALDDPVGVVLESFTRPNGLAVEKVRVPLGVIAVVYEARPNVTIDAAALAIKSGNAIVLRGSSTAIHSNAVLVAIAAESAPTPDAVQLVAGGREELAELATQDDLVDLIIPRGGEGLKKALQEVATVPVIYAAAGNCHVYVDASADLENAQAIILNAKTQRPGVCNAAETLLVHRAIAEAFLPETLARLHAAGVELRVDDATAAHAGDTPVQAADEDDWGTEYLALVLAVKVVDTPFDAIAHINHYGSGHSEAIVTGDKTAARAFELGIDAACVYVNASTRFTDGNEFGMGAEIGNSTQKLHARGPVALRELCTFKYLVRGDGQIRE
ncbi:MAG TPA: glutamate-5-semialdehyde dehydrogenase [Baekduia sp.]|nr:glutamate-5-semialdehyde dehydrogenase [Baekduia sp.]